MPELPEVETVRAGLSKLLPGLEIGSVSHDWPKSFPNSQADVEQFLVGAKVVKVARRGKVLLMELSSKYSLVIHLKMTGQLVFVGNKRNEQKYASGSSGEQNVGAKSSNGQSRTNGTVQGVAEASSRQAAASHPGQATWSVVPAGDEERWGAGHPNDSLIGKLPDKSTRVIITFEPESEGITAGLEANARKQRSAEQGVQKMVRRTSTGAADTAVGQERWQSFGLRPKAGQRGPQLFFNDQRKFGWMRLMPTAEVVQLDFFKKIGPEPLATDFTWQDFRTRLERRLNSGIKAVLLDQTVVAGIGNIYADESLWGAKIHPATLVKDLSAQKIKKLYESLIAVLKLSIEKGGSTDRNYVDAEGRRGSYLSFANVFRREGQPCPRCGTTIIKIRVAGRGTHICPKCQKESTK